MNPTGETLYLAGSGVMAERLLGTGGVVQWTNYLSAGGEMVGMRVDRPDATTYTRYFHKDHLGSIATITDAAGAVVERLSYDAWGKRRFPNGQDDPSGSIASQTTRGFTGHEQLADVGLIHMNGRVYDPMLDRFGTPDPMTEDPYNSQGWNRYTYVGNSPLNATDPSGYCWKGCFWQAPFKALGAALRRTPILGNILTVAAAAICTPAGLGPVCGALASAAVTGLASGDLGQALKAGAIALATAAAFNVAGDITAGAGPLAKVAAHAAIGCGSAVASGGKCGSGALSGAIGAATTVATRGMDFTTRLIAVTTMGGLASVAGGGKFGNGAVTAAFGYLFNELSQRVGTKALGKIALIGTGWEIEEIEAAIHALQGNSATASSLIDALANASEGTQIVFGSGPTENPGSVYSVLEKRIYYNPTQYQYDGSEAWMKALFAVRMGFIQWRQPGSVLA